MVDPRASLASRLGIRRVLLMVLALIVLGSNRSLAQESPFVDPVPIDLEGWTIHVDPSLLEGEHKPLGDEALQMLAAHLQRAAILVPEPALAKIRTVVIRLDRDNPTLNGMQYHPSEDWLRNNGHDPRLARQVHICEAAQLVSREQLLKHPAAVLHELAHAYHDQFLDFGHPAIIDAYEKSKEAGIYEKVLLYTGDEVEHYGLSNHKEYFAEATEAYFYRNDFYPFVRAELERHDPQMARLLKELWEDK